jgi:ADP-heptose:LPS heptosyltransferase
VKNPAFVTHTPSIGDLLSATPTIKKLAQTYGKKVVVISHNPWVLKNNPYISENLHIDDVNLEHYSSFYDLHETFHLIGKRDPLGVEWKHAMCDIRQYHAKDLGIMLTPEEMECSFFPDSEDCISHFNLPENYVVLHPAQTWDSRTWEFQKWQDLCDRLSSVGIPVVSIGKDSSENSDHLNQEKPSFKLSIQKGIDLTNQTTFDQSWHIINKAKCVITMDSGVLHLAGTTDTHIIQLGSSIHPYYRAPYRKGSQYYKYDYISGECKIHCASDLSYSLRDWGNIQSVTLINTCLENKKDFPCKPSSISVAEKVIDVFNSAETKNFKGSFDFGKKEVKIETEEIDISTFEVDFKVSFTKGPKVEIIGNDLDPRNFNVIFIDYNTDEEVYSSNIRINHWTKSSRIYYTKWKIQVWSMGNLIHEEIMDLEEKPVFIRLSNTSLGDTLAWIPYILEFKKNHKCAVLIETPHHKILSKSYPEYDWVDQHIFNEEDERFYASYSLGYGVAWELHTSEMKIVNKNFLSRRGDLYSEKVRVWDQLHHPRDPHKIPLAAIGSDILGLEYVERRPKIFNSNPSERPIQGKYVCISEFASARGLKEWNNKVGWEKLVEKLKSQGYQVVSISKEKSNLKNVTKRNGNYDLEDRAWYLHHCEFFIGVSSGLAWLAWACGKKAVMISGATSEWNEFVEDNIRIIEKTGCHGCWNSDEHSHKFGCFHDTFCPENKNFECTRKISPNYVWDKMIESGLV